MALAGVCMLPAWSGAKGSARSLAVGQQAALPIVFDASNAPHVFYQSSDYQRPDIRPYHAWLSNGKWKRERIDPVNDSGGGLSAAIDSTGVIHVSYGGHSGISRLVYARRDTNGWTVTDLGVIGGNTAIHLDGDDQPHIYFINLSGLKHAYIEASAWVIEDTGIGVAGRAQIVVDSAGFVHACSGGTFLDYATNSSGHWVATRLGNMPARGSFSIAVDSGLVPHVVVAEVSDLIHYSKPEDVWTSEVVIGNARILGMSMDGISLAIGPDDSLHMLLGASLNDAWMFPFYVFFNGDDWSVSLVDGRNTGYWPTIRPDHDGIMHATYASSGTRRGSSLYAVALPLADLAGSWQGVALSTSRGSTTISGDLEVQNLGEGASAKSSVALWLSVDPELSDDDELLTSRPLSLKSIKPGGSGRVRARVRHAGAAPVGYLIAHLDPDDEVADADVLNNVVVTPLP